MISEIAFWVCIVAAALTILNIDTGGNNANN